MIFSLRLLLISKNQQRKILMIAMMNKKIYQLMFLGLLDSINFS